MVDKKAFFLIFLSFIIAVPVLLFILAFFALSLPFLFLVGVFALVAGIIFSLLHLLYFIYSLLGDLFSQKKEKPGSGYSLRQSKGVK